MTKRDSGQGVWINDSKGQRKRNKNDSIYALIPYRNIEWGKKVCNENKNKWKKKITKRTTSLFSDFHGYKRR